MLVPIEKNIVEANRDEVLASALEAAQEALTRYELAIGSSQCGVWSWNLVTGEKYRSPHWKAILGFIGEFEKEAPEEVARLTHPEDLARMRDDSFPAFLRGDSIDYRCESRHQHRDGSWRWILSRARATRDANGKALRITGIYLDITDRKIAEQEQIRVAERNRAAAIALKETVLPTLPENLISNFLLTTVHGPVTEDMEIRGEFFDAFPLAGGKGAVVVGDVSGHGLEAALAITEIRVTLRGYLLENVFSEPSDTLRRLNRFLFQSYRLQNRSPGSSTGSLVALSLAILYPSTGKVRLSSAGMPPAMVIRAHDDRTELLESTGLMLGADNNAVYESQQFTLAPQDCLVLKTDTVQHLNSKSIVQAKRPEQDGKATDTLQRLIEDAIHDDSCLLIAQRINEE